MSKITATETAALVKAASALIATNESISMTDLLRALSPDQVSAPAPSKVPAPRTITAAQRAAVESMTGVYGQVVPETRRELTEAEVGTLLNERVTLDEVSKTARARLDDITVIVHNHFDVEIEKSSDADALLLDKHGHYIAEGKVTVEDQSVEFSRETREGAASLPLSGLQELLESGEIDNKTFLALTTQTRVVDENKVLAEIKKTPALLAKIATVTQPGVKGTSMYVRKRK